MFCMSKICENCERKNGNNNAEFCNWCGRSFANPFNIKEPTVGEKNIKELKEYIKESIHFVINIVQLIALVLFLLIFNEIVGVLLFIATIGLLVFIAFTLEVASIVTGIISGTGCLVYIVGHLMRKDWGMKYRVFIGFLLALFIVVLMVIFTIDTSWWDGNDITEAPWNRWGIPLVDMFEWRY